MPEEKYRTIADHLSDLIYCYLDDYKIQGISEGIPDSNIVVTGNPIVDVIQEYFLSGKLRMADFEVSELLDTKYGIVQNGNYFVMTCHRRENVESHAALMNIMALVVTCPFPVLFPCGYRTQRMLREFNIELPSNLRLVDPIGYLELLELITGSSGVLTDSGTIVEEAAVLGIPSVQMRTATERPQVYECGASIKFDPSNPKENDDVIKRVLALRNSKWEQPFGDGKASYRIVSDLVRRYELDIFAGHQKEKYEPHSILSYSDELN
jgi:UDP-N-acetylglucosamine 2-epimerase (non-hydrolysing)